MHSRIFRIGTEVNDELFDIDRSLYFGDHWFVGDVADFVVEDDDPEFSAGMLKEYLTSRHIEFLPNEETVLLTFKVDEHFAADHFSERFFEFKKTLMSLCNWTINDFAGYTNISTGMWSLSTLYENRFDFWIEEVDGDFITIDEFIRNIKPYTIYYVGGSLDYHA